MILLSNGRRLEYVVASGALAFDGQGWFWERPLVRLGFIKPELFTVVVKTLTRQPRPGNLRWWKPWECLRLIPGGSVNKIGLTNPGIEWWCDKVAPHLDFEKIPVVVSIFGEWQESVEMAKMLNRFPLVAIEHNPSCPNTGHAMHTVEAVISNVKEVKRVSRHPVIVKLSVDQDYLAIERALRGVAEAINLNSVPIKKVFPNGDVNPLWRLERKVGGGGGGVSGRPAQRFNWAAAEDLTRNGKTPAIWPSIMDFEDIEHISRLGAKAVSFGAIHLPDHPFWLKPWTLFTNPCKPTKFVRRIAKAHRDLYSIGKEGRI